MDNSSLLCEFCDKIFTSKASLSKHQKTTKYCLKKQGIKNEEYKCNYCSKILATQLRLNTHINICKLKDKKSNKYISLYEEKEEEMKKYIALSQDNEKEKEKELNDYKILVSELKMESLMKDKIIEELKNGLEKSNNAIFEIAKQPKIIHTNSHNDYNYDSEDEDENYLLLFMKN